MVPRTVFQQPAKTGTFVIDFERSASSRNASVARSAMMSMFQVYTAMIFFCGGICGFCAGVVGGPKMEEYFESRRRETLALIDAPTVQPMSGKWRLVRRDGVGDNPSGKAFLLTLPDARGLVMTQ